MTSSAGKGDTPRPVKKETWDKNYERIFNDKREPKDFQRDKTSNPASV